jgi:hypothetical protein
MREEFSIIPAKLAGFLFIAGVTIVSTVILLVVVVVQGKGEIAVLVVGLSLMLVAPFLLFALRGSRGATFEVSSEALRIRGDLWRRTIPMRSLDLANALVLDLKKSPEFQTTWKTCGSKYPGYKSGWWRIKKGGKVLVYLTDETRVAYIPTHLGYSVMLSTPNPQRLIDALRR